MATWATAAQRAERTPVTLQDATKTALVRAGELVTGGDMQGAQALLTTTLQNLTVSGEPGDYAATTISLARVLSLQGEFGAANGQYVGWLNQTPTEYVADAYANWTLSLERFGDLRNTAQTLAGDKPSAASARLMVALAQADIRQGQFDDLNKTIERAAKQIRETNAQQSKTVLMGLWGFVHGENGAPSQVALARTIQSALGADAVDGNFLLNRAALEERVPDAKAAREALELAKPRLAADDFNVRARWLWSSANVHYMVQEYHPALADLDNLENLIGRQEVSIGIDLPREIEILREIMNNEYQKKFGVPLTQENPANDANTGTILEPKGR